jgi:hypothetical protein
MWIFDTSAAPGILLFTIKSRPNSHHFPQKLSLEKKPVQMQKPRRREAKWRRKRIINFDAKRGSRDDIIQHKNGEVKSRAERAHESNTSNDCDDIQVMGMSRKERAARFLNQTSGPFFCHGWHEEIHNSINRLCGFLGRETEKARREAAN